MTDKIKVVWCPIKLGIDLVVLDLAYYVIGLKTQCLWVTSTPIPSLHCQAMSLFQ